MDQFMKLPPGQKAAVLAAILAVIGLGMYFLLVDPQLGRASQARGAVSKTEKDLADLKTVASLDELAKLRKQNDELNEKNKEAKKMLPATEEVPDLIDSVQGDALRCGLQVPRFERLAAEPQDMFTGIPIRMSVEGKMLDFVRFMRIYAGNDRRVIHLRELAIEQLPTSPAVIKEKLAAARPDRKVGDTTGVSDAARLLRTIEEAELGFELAEIRATFTAYAYTWTGKPAPAGASPTGAGPKKRT